MVIGFESYAFVSLLKINYMKKVLTSIMLLASFGCLAQTSSNSFVDAPVCMGNDIEENFGSSSFKHEESFKGIYILKDKTTKFTDIVYIYEGNFAGIPKGEPLMKLVDISDNIYLESSVLPEYFTIYRNGGTGYKFHKIIKN